MEGKEDDVSIPDLLILKRAPALPPRRILVLQAAVLSGLTKAVMMVVPQVAVLVVANTVRQVAEMLEPGKG